MLEVLIPEGLRETLSDAFLGMRGDGNGTERWTGREKLSSETIPRFVITVKENY